MHKVTKVSEALIIIEKLDNAIDKAKNKKNSHLQFRVTISFDNIDDKEGIIKLAKQEKGTCFEPEELVDYFFATIRLGNLDCTFRQINKN